MRQRKRNNVARICNIVLLAFVLIACGAGEGFAQIPVNPITVIGSDGTICPAYSGFTAKIVNCIQSTITWATYNYLGDFNRYFILTVDVLAIFAVILYGFLVFTGRTQAIMREGVMLTLKVGVVVWLVNLGAFGTLFPAMIDMINWVLTRLTGYTNVPYPNGIAPMCPYSPDIWNRIDCALNLIFGGLIPGTTVASGLIGFVGALLFSQGVGISLFFFGMAIILAVLMALTQALFILISANIALALLTILAPMMIPLMLFRVTKAYFEKWVRLLIGVMLQPLFLFTYLVIFLIALEISLFTGPYSVYRSIACDRVDQPGFMIGNYIMGSGAVAQRTDASAIVSMVVGQNAKFFEGSSIGTTSQAGGALGTEAVKPTADQGDMLYNNGAGISVNVDTNAVDIPWLAQICGPQMTAQVYFLRLLLSMFTAMAVIYIFYTMLQFIPYLGTIISSDKFGLPNLSNFFQGGALNSYQLSERFGLNKGGGNR